MDQDGRPLMKKAFYLACGFCRWTSRDVGIKDQPVSSGGWRDQENINEKRIGALLDYYRQLAMREKAESEKKRYTRRKGFYQLSERYSAVSSALSRTRSGLMSSLSREVDELRIQEVSTVATDVTEELSDSFYTEPLVLAQITTVSQRLSSPELQPVLSNQLYPRHKQLLVKHSKRCRECDHNLSKPEYNPSSIKFKINLSALFHVPELKIKSMPNLKVNQPSQVILTMCNPLDFLSHVTLLPCDPLSDSWSNAKIELPVCELLLSRCDESVDFDDSISEQQHIEDDQTVVVFRKANKIGFFVTVTPLDDKDDVKVSFRLKHDYQTMASSLAAADKEPKEPEFVWLEHVVCVNLGPISPA